MLRSVRNTLTAALLVPAAGVVVSLAAPAWAATHDTGSATLSKCLNGLVKDTAGITKSLGGAGSVDASGIVGGLAQHVTKTADTVTSLAKLDKLGSLGKVGDAGTGVCTTADQTLGHLTAQPGDITGTASTAVTGLSGVATNLLGHPAPGGPAISALGTALPGGLTAPLTGGTGGPLTGAASDVANQQLGEVLGAMTGDGLTRFVR